MGRDFFMVSRIKIGFFTLSLSMVFIMSCQENKNPLELIMNSELPKIKSIKSELASHEVQILYTQIERSADWNPSFNEFSFQLEADNYFYPASTAKLPVAILALQRIKELRSSGSKIDMNTEFEIFNPKSNEVILSGDSTERDNKATIAHMVKKIFLVSDNDAYNYLFEFLGRDYINQELNKRNIGPAHINHKFQSGANNKQMMAFRFKTEAGIEVIEGSVSQVDKHSMPLKKLIKGVGYTDDSGNLFNNAFDFSEKNYFSLQSLNKIIKSIIFPANIPEKERFNLTEADYNFLKLWMSRLPRESDFPNYNDEEHYDSYVKFLIFGDDLGTIEEDDIRIYNKIGMAYGTLTEAAYIVDEKNDIEFMLSATILINDNGIFNDGIYEYEEKGLPFLAELGRQVYQFELNRKNKPAK
jgi:hypothetical protein